MATVRMTKTIRESIAGRVGDIFKARRVAINERLTALQPALKASFDALLAEPLAKWAKMDPFDAYTVETIDFDFGGKLLPVPANSMWVSAGFRANDCLRKLSFSHEGLTMQVQGYRYSPEKLIVKVTWDAMMGSNAINAPFWDWTQISEQARELAREQDEMVKQVNKITSQASTVNIAVKIFPPIRALLSPDVVAQLEAPVQRRGAPPEVNTDGVDTEALAHRIAIARMRGAL